jgi:hypothetical protein
MYGPEQLASKPLFPTASKSTCDINNTLLPSPATMHALYCLGDRDDDIVAILGCPSGVSYKCISVLTKKGTSKAQRHKRPSRIDENKERDHSRDTHSNTSPHTTYCIPYPYAHIAAPLEQETHRLGRLHRLARHPLHYSNILSPLHAWFILVRETENDYFFLKKNLCAFGS